MAEKSRLWVTVIWGAVAASSAIAIFAAANSPLLAWRDPIYIAAGLAGIVALCLMLVQPLLAAEFLPPVLSLRGRRLHRWVGGILVAAILIHVAGLWITSPPDMVDALLFVSPTPFSAWGVIAMWAVVFAALLVIFRRRLHLRPRTWRRAHTALVMVAVGGSVVHAMLIEGTMGTVSKTVLCTFAIMITVKTVLDLRVWANRPRRGA